MAPPHHTPLLQFPRTQLAHLLSVLKHHGPNSRTLTTAALATAGTSLALFAAWVIRDYYAWTAFGTGGTPATPAGYWRMTKIRIARAFAKDDLADGRSLSVIGPKYLAIDLPDRNAAKRARPVSMARTMPQRQVPSATPLAEDVRAAVHALPEKYCAQLPDRLRLDRSHTEGRSTDAIYAKADCPGRKKGAQDRILKDEIAHVHPAENSLHVWLSEPDARAVVAAGWGERFPLTFVHPGWVFVYAPESMDDVRVIEEIVKAGIAHLTGEKV